MGVNLGRNAMRSGGRVFPGRSQQGHFQEQEEQGLLPGVTCTLHSGIPF